VLKPRNGCLDLCGSLASRVSGRRIIIRPDPFLSSQRWQPDAQLRPPAVPTARKEFRSMQSGYIFLKVNQGAVISTKERDFYITQALNPGIRAKRDAATLDYTVVSGAENLPGVLVIQQCQKLA